MGVRAVEHEANCFCQDYDACCTCGLTATTASTASTTSASNAHAQKFHQKSTNKHFENNFPTTTSADAAPTATCSRSCKELIGNHKEFRIENNKSDLRIIGNSNRIRIGSNCGDLQIVGNNTRLKIDNNNGDISYTGNDGRISLGDASTQQLVNYVGCNGVLKIVNATELKCQQQQKRTTDKTDNSTAKKCNNNCHCGKSAAGNRNKKLNGKSASYGGNGHVNANSSGNFQQFSQLIKTGTNWQNFVNLSLPNLISNYDLHKQSQSQSQSHAAGNNVAHKMFCNTSNNENISNKYGNINIRNSMNISI